MRTLLSIELFTKDNGSPRHMPCFIKISLFAVILWSYLLNPRFIIAQPMIGWSSPLRFFEVDQGGNVQSPTLLTDSGGNLHVFWGASMAEGQPMALYYSRWQDDAWTEPVDVLLSPDGGSIWPFAADVDESDYVHVFWMSGGQLWHSTAHATQLNNARRWSPPDIVPTDETPFTTLGLAQDSDGVWYLAYSNRDLDTITLLKSEDGANSWDSVGTIYQEVRPDTWVGYPGIVVAPDGALWASWQEMESGSGISKGLAYARSEDGGESWSMPEQLIDGYYFGGFEVVGDIMVKKYGGGVGTGGRYISFSYDDGATWTEPRSIGMGGGEGAQGIGLTTDGSGKWHFVEQTGGSFAAVAWDGSGWSEPNYVVSPEELDRCCTPAEVENPVGTVSNGNRFHIFFEEGNRLLWYASRVLDAPVAPANPVTAPTLATQADSTPVAPTADPATSTKTADKAADGDLSDRSKSQSISTAPPANTSPLKTVLFGVTPAAVLVVLVLLFLRSRPGHR